MPGEYIIISGIVFSITIAFMMGIVVGAFIAIRLKDYMYSK